MADCAAGMGLFVEHKGLNLLAYFSSHRNLGRMLRLPALEYVGKPTLSHFINRRIQPEHLQWQKIPAPELVKKPRLTKVVSATVVASVELEVKLNEQITVEIAFTQWIVVVVIILMELTLYLFLVSTASTFTPCFRNNP